MATRAPPLLKVYYRNYIFINEFEVDKILENILGWVEISLLIVELFILFYLVKHVLALERHEKKLENHEKILEKQVEEIKSHFAPREEKNEN